jgi:hypothetical protein
VEANAPKDGSGLHKPPAVYFVYLKSSQMVRGLSKPIFTTRNENAYFSVALIDRSYALDSLKLRRAYDEQVSLGIVAAAHCL